MSLDTLSAISPIDGRYSKSTEILSQYFSEFALIRYRVMVEIEYFIELNSLKLLNFKKLNQEEIKKLRALYEQFTLVDAKEIKEIEKETNHDVKAVEYFIKKKLGKAKFGGNLEYIHFGLTSQDINNTATPLLLKNAVKEVLILEISNTVKELNTLAKKTKNISMLARTHGQPASPTTLGKEIFVFVSRLNTQLSNLKKFEYVGKFGGATGNLNAHYVSFPKIKWDVFATKFLKRIGLKRNPVTTQIDSYDNFAELFDLLRRINVILIDLDRDIWQYISMNYFGQKTKVGEIGSSAMPHKVNPIDFENSEGNLGIANSIYSHFSNKLPISRLQRDLTDSTVLRNIGVPLAHTLIALKSLQKGLSKLEVNKKVIIDDLNGHYEVIAEAIQTVLRREGVETPYEKLKELTRGKKITKEIIDTFIDGLKISEGLKKELKAITPENYIGMAREIVK